VAFGAILEVLNPLVLLASANGPKVPFLEEPVSTILEDVFEGIVKFRILVLFAKVKVTITTSLKDVVCALIELVFEGTSEDEATSEAIEVVFETSSEEESPCAAVEVVFEASSGDEVVSEETMVVFEARLEDEAIPDNVLEDELEDMAELVLWKLLLLESVLEAPLGPEVALVEELDANCLPTRGSGARRSCALSAACPSCSALNPKNAQKSTSNMTDTRRLPDNASRPITETTEVSCRLNILHAPARPCGKKVVLATLWAHCCPCYPALHPAASAHRTIGRRKTC
jgi:hypothetical protein